MPLPSDVILRDARTDEHDVVANVILESYAEYGPPETASAEWRAAFQEYREEMADVGSRAKRGAVVIAAERAGRVIGVVTYLPPGADKTEEGWPEGYGAVRLLGVLPSERGAGIGRALTEECIERTRKAGGRALGLHTTDLMHVARDMYLRMGFRRVPERDFVPAPEVVVAGYELIL